MEVESIRERILSPRPPAVVFDLPGHGGVSFRSLVLRDLESLIARRRLSPIEFAVEILAGQTENPFGVASVLRELPRPTLLRLVRLWATHPDTFKATPSQIRSFSDFKLIAESKVDEWLLRSQEIRQRIVDQFISPTAEAQKIFVAVSKIDHQLTEVLTESINAVAASIDSAAGEFEEHARELGARGWTMPMWAPIELLADLAQFTNQTLDSVFLRAYSAQRKERETQLLAGLLAEPGLLHWRPLLAECIEVYRKRNYRVVVPSLLPVVEGAVYLAIGLYSREIRPQRVAAQEVCARDPGLMRTAWGSVEAFLGAVFCRYNFGDPRPPLINRHWICHGRDVPEWGRIDCLRLFQALDTIAALISSGASCQSGRDETPDREGS